MISKTSSLSIKPQFNFARPKFVASGKLNRPDDVAKAILDAMDKILGQPLFDDCYEISINNPEKTELVESEVKLSDEKKAVAKKDKVVIKSIKEFLEQPFHAIWEDITHISSSNKPVNTIREAILKYGLTNLRTKVKNMVQEESLGYNAGLVLERSNVFDFLFIWANIGNEIAEADSVASFMLDEEDGGGLRPMYDIIVDAGVDKIVKDDKLKIEGKGTDKKIKDELKAKGVSLAAGAFSEDIRKRLKMEVFNADPIMWLDDAGDKLALNIREEEKPALLDFIKNVGITGTESVKFMLPVALAQLRSNEFKVSNSSTSPLSDSDFSVTYYEDDRSAMVINRENILCSAQAFYVMTLADEMELFNVANRIITKHFNSSGIKIPSRESHSMLKLYLFGDSFKDAKDGNIYKRTLPEERWLVYKGLFDAGDVEVMEGMMVNQEFNGHWEVLMTEVVKYLDKAEKSENPEYFVSRQNIMQAIEDLQYNLSSYCTTMAKVAGPVINAELDFVMKEILQNQEITNRLARDGSNSVWKMIEYELAAMRNGAAPNVKALYDKARYGDAIMRAIADYTPATFDNTFTQFIGLVEAFIIANSKIEMGSAGRRSSMPDDMEESPAQDGYGGGNGNYNYQPNGHKNGAMPKDDWNF